MKGVIAWVEVPGTEESIVVHVDRLAFSSPRLRDALESSVSFDSRVGLLLVLHCMISMAKALWSNLLCLRLRGYMPLRPCPLH